MPSHRATVTCPDCELHESFEKLGDARARIETHRRETGHDPVWELGELDKGVVRAGDAAGVCGIPGSSDGFATLGTDDE
jgi:hypothetical protein